MEEDSSIEVPVLTALTWAATASETLAPLIELLATAELLLKTLMEAVGCFEVVA